MSCCSHSDPFLEAPLVPGTAPKAKQRLNDVSLVAQTRLTNLLGLVVEVVRLA